MSLKTYDDMTAAFPNVVQKGEIGSVPARSDLLPAPFTDFVYGHSPRAPFDLDTPGAVIFLVRNPLDNVVSWWHHAFRLKGSADPIEAMAADRLRQFAKKYAIMQDLSREHGFPIVHYEDIMERPVPSFAAAFKAVGLPVNEELIALAADHASIRNARAFEDKHGYMHVKNPKKRDPSNGKRFVRDGSIGQWKEHFPDGLKMVANAGMDPRGFRFTPAPSPAHH